MTNRVSDLRPREEPVAVHPALRTFVEAARQQPIVAPKLSADAVQRAWLQQQRERKQIRRSLALGVTLGLAAAAVVAVIVQPLLGSDSSGSALAQHDSIAVERSDERASAARGEAAHASEHDVARSPTEAAPSRAELSPAIRLRSDPSAEPPQVLGPWTIALAHGEHEIELDEGNQPLLLELPGRRLELVHGTLRVEIVEGNAVVRLQNGVAAWVTDDGVRTDISVERIELDKPRKERAPSAAELAREIEAKLAGGERDAARTGLRQLIKKYPRSTQARTGLLDLALLERTSGNRDAARCAYLLYLERWPEGNLRGEVETQLGRLGEGRACRGLDPK